MELNKYQEALDRLKLNIVIIRSDYVKSGKAKEDVKMLRELVDKATPKKPKRYTYDNINLISKEKTTHHIHLCPNCRYEVKLDYCPLCGQALDWRKDDEE